MKKNATMLFMNVTYDNDNSNNHLNYSLCYSDEQLFRLLNNIVNHPNFHVDHINSRGHGRCHRRFF